MGRSSALYRDDTMRPSPRTEVTVEGSELALHLPDGRWRQLQLDGTSNLIGDATCRRRFVRMVTIERLGESTALITPPELASIAPRAAHLPAAPDDAMVVETSAWEAVADWIASGGRLAGRTIDELARLACIASAPFAVTIGEVCAQVARDLARLARGPLRGVHDALEWLRPLQIAARSSPRAEEALVAALAACTG